MSWNNALPAWLWIEMGIIDMIENGQDTSGWYEHYPHVLLSLLGSGHRLDICKVLLQRWLYDR